VKRAVGFLDSVQTDEGSGYGYRGPGNTPALTAAGLLCRMYLGWKKDHPALNRGLDRLSKIGPSKDLYYDYYGTQVMHHVEGDHWISWNTKMRDMLVKAQAQQGHEAGSWFEGFEAGHGPPERHGPPARYGPRDSRPARSRPFAALIRSHPAPLGSSILTMISP
jgi:hypothetical protein